MKFVYSSKCWIESRSNFAKLKVSLRKTNMRQKGLSYSGHSLWNNLPGSMKKPNVLNTFKHNLKKKYLGNLAGSYRINRVIIGTHLYSLPIHLFVYILIYLSICILIRFTSLSLFQPFVFNFCLTFLPFPLPSLKIYFIWFMYLFGYFIIFLTCSSLSLSISLFAKYLCIFSYKLILSLIAN